MKVEVVIGVVLEAVAADARGNDGAGCRVDRQTSQGSQNEGFQKHSAGSIASSE